MRHDAYNLGPTKVLVRAWRSVTEPATLGAYLRAARRRRRVSIERAADDTRIRADFLMRMESDEFDFFAPAYVRGFLKTYARFLHLKPEPLLEEFDRRYGAAKFETGQIAALERRSKQVPKQRRMNNWATAAVIATVVLVGLAAIGLATGKDDDPARTVAQTDETPQPEDTATTGAEDDPTPTPSPEETFIALTDAIELEVIAAKADCWLEVYADGDKLLYYTTLAAGDSEVFRAEEKMFVRLGYPAGVELIVNGKNIGSPGGQDPIEIVLPDDVESYF